MAEFTNGFEDYGPEDYVRRPQPKQPWPRPQITYQSDYQGWKVYDSVTEGWVMVPLEAVEALLGRHITNPAKVTHRSEIEKCAQRLLILLVYGCPTRLNSAPTSPPKPENWWSDSSKYAFL